MVQPPTFSAFDIFKPTNAQEQARMDELTRQSYEYYMHHLAKDSESGQEVPEEFIPTDMRMVWYKDGHVLGWVTITIETDIPEQ